MTVCAAQFIFDAALAGSITFAAVPASTAVDQTVSVPGLFKDAFTLVVIPNLQDGLVFCNAQASANGSLKIRFMNETGGDLTPSGVGVRIVQF